jgi:ATP/maltotriose-dependent transcriptional regulator MalT
MRTDPMINLDDLYHNGLVSEITEDDLRFSCDEIAGALEMRGITQDADSLDWIHEDTAGCAFTLNLVSGMLSGGYKYMKGRAKDKINELLESEVWGKISIRLKTLLLRMSLINLLPEELVITLAERNRLLLTELRSLDRYVSYDSYRKIYDIHDLFQAFLLTHQSDLADDLRDSAFRAAAA